MAAVIGNSRNVTGCRMAADERPIIGVTSTTGMTGGYVDPASALDLRAHKRKLKAAAIDANRGAKRKSRHRNRRAAA